jgi:hypothetical protein
MAEEHKDRGILIIATNDREDTALCNIRINIEDFKTNKQ